MRYHIKFTFLIFILILAGCKDSVIQDKQDDSMNSGVPAVSEEIRVMLNNANYRVLFGHHSVGENILDGLRAITQETGSNYKIVSLDTVSAARDANLAHFSPGRNKDPKSKIEGFVEQMGRLPDGFALHAAFLKFCYVDFAPDTNIEEVMAYYKERIETLKSRYPKTRFFHCTVPLTMRPTDMKSRVKRFLGLQVWDDASNISRTRFNTLLHATFPEDPIFDLARVESTRQDGKRTEFTHKGKTYPSMAPEYTDDGGHLNVLGRRAAASDLVSFLNKVSLLDK